MTAIATDPTATARRRPRHAPRRSAPLATLAAPPLRAQRRTPRELFVPLLTPMLFALVIAPALHDGAAHRRRLRVFVAVGTVGLLIPLNTHVRRARRHRRPRTGAQRELLAAPIPRPLLVLGNLARRARRHRPPGRRADRRRACCAAIEFHVDGDRRRVVRRRRPCCSRSACTAWRRRSPAACRRQEEYIARVPGDRDRAVVPRRLAVPDHRAARRPDRGSRRFLPLTHALALMRYGLLRDARSPRNLGHEQRERDGRAQPRSRQWVRALLTFVSIRVLNRSAVE